MPCVAQGGFPSVQAEMICDSWQLDFYGCTAMACKPWSESAQGRSRSTMRWRTSWLERTSASPCHAFGSRELDSPFQLKTLLHYAGLKPAQMRNFAQAKPLGIK